MGYTTEFVGGFTITPPLRKEDLVELDAFIEQRHEPVPGEEPVPPSYYCQWHSVDGSWLEWDLGEKFYEADNWLVYLIDNFFGPRGYILNGECTCHGEETGDDWFIQITDNRVMVGALEFVRSRGAWLN